MERYNQLASEVEIVTKVEYWTNTEFTLIEEKSFVVSSLFFSVIEFLLPLKFVIYQYKVFDWYVTINIIIDR